MNHPIARIRPSNLIIALVAATWCGGAFCGNGGLGLDSSVYAQGLDDLFAEPAGGQLSEQVPAGPPAESRAPESVRSPSDVRLYNSNGSGENAAPSVAMQIRQARALEETRQRIARLEAARWAGEPALRPNWNASPMTASRFTYRRVFYVPVYFHNR